MRRRRQGAAANIALFLVALSLILYFNRETTSNTSFEWTKIRYKTTSARLPEARGICPGLEDSSKPALVVARTAAEKLKWLDTLTDFYHLCVYTADAPADLSSTYLQVPANRGHEAMAYLTFLIDNYENIPASGAVFVHGSRWAWHNDAPDYDNAALLTALNVSAALVPVGYHNLRCDWSTSTCPSEALPQGSVETFTRAMLEPWNARAASDAALPRALAALFGGDTDTVNSNSAADTSKSAKGDGTGLLLGRSDAVRAQCCAQFVVARENVWLHSRDEYVALRQWLLGGSSNRGTVKNLQRHDESAAPIDDQIAGRILSYVWHILFIKQSEPNAQSPLPGALENVDLERLNMLACPRADECYCRLYGRCNLKGCTAPGHCRGQYHLPPNLKLPEDWGAAHS